MSEYGSLGGDLSEVCIIDLASFLFLSVFVHLSDIFDCLADFDEFFLGRGSDYFDWGCLAIDPEHEGWGAWKA